MLQGNKNWVLAWGEPHHSSRWSVYIIRFPQRFFTCLFSFQRDLFLPPKSVKQDQPLNIPSPRTGWMRTYHPFVFSQPRRVSRSKRIEEVVHGPKGSPSRRGSSMNMRTHTHTHQQLLCKETHLEESSQEHSAVSIWSALTL